MFNVQTQPHQKGDGLRPKWNIVPMEKALWPQENVASWLIAAAEKGKGMAL